jgi:hypothetical protein
MSEQPPITPPPELVQEWVYLIATCTDIEVFSAAAQWGADQQLKLDAEQIEKAYQAGADQELEACCEWTVANFGERHGRNLYLYRRPRPPSLKERALHELADVYNRDKIDDSAYDTIRLALEALPDD